MKQLPQSFSEWINRKNFEMDKAGDGYDSLSELSKKSIDYAIKRYMQEVEATRAMELVEALEKIKEYCKLSSTDKVSDRALKQLINPIIETALDNYNKVERHE